MFTFILKNSFLAHLLQSISTIKTMDLYRTCENGQVILSELWEDNHPDCDDKSDVLPLLVRKLLPKSAGEEMMMAAKSGDEMMPVSYTHLTLPTICSV